MKKTYKKKQNKQINKTWSYEAGKGHNKQLILES